jgi:hypothetical protein
MTVVPTPVMKQMMVLKRLACHRYLALLFSAWDSDEDMWLT